MVLKANSRCLANGMEKERVRYKCLLEEQPTNTLPFKTDKLSDKEKEKTC